MPERLTDEVVRHQAAGTVWDDPAAGPVENRGIRGFGLRVYAGGAKSFFLNYRMGGAERRYTIGRWPEWSVDAARQEARELRRQIDRGHDPAQNKRERREAPTVHDLRERYIVDHLPRKTAGPDSERDELRMLYLVEAHLGKHTKVADVHFGDVEDMHKRLTEAKGPVRANRVLALTSKMFSLSLKPRAGENIPWRDAAAGNPCRGVERNPEHGRERYFSEAELAAITDALDQYGAGARGPGIASARSAADCIRLIMLTGCRPAEAMKATWEQFDAEPGFWIKPAATFKTRRAHKLPLNPAAIELVEGLRTRRRKGATWVFEGQRKGQPLKQLNSVWGFVRKHANLQEGDRRYDLRHSFASIGAAGGLGLHIIGKLLGHTQARTTQRYAHLADDPLRAAAAQIGGVITNAGKPEPRDNVISISRGD